MCMISMILIFCVCVLKRDLLVSGCHRVCVPRVCQLSKIIGLQHSSHTLHCNGFKEGLGNRCHTQTLKHTVVHQHTALSLAGGVVIEVS